MTHDDVRRRRPAPPVLARLALALTVGAALAALTISTAPRLIAQGATPEFQSGKNVDIVGPSGSAPYSPSGSNPFLLGDPDKKQQNEPSCDVSPNNPLIVFCGMNTYSAVDRPDVVGEPWVGASFTLDGGLTWKSHLHPGFGPSVSGSPAPLVPPLGYETAADPVVRLAPGLGLFTFIAFNRDGNGALLMGRWYERTLEGGFPYGYRDTVQVAKGTGSPGQSGRFLDKPASLISLLPGTATTGFVVPDPAPGNPTRTRIQQIPQGIVHVAYTVLTGNQMQDGTRILYTRSMNYGDSFEPATALSESQSINQAPDIASDIATHRVVIVWRRFAGGKQTDAIVSAVSNDDGRSFGKPVLVSNICAFTQNSTSSSFRTTTHPFITFDGTAFHAVWAERQGACGSPATGFSRIVMSNLSFVGATPKWSNRTVVDSASPSSRRGHEFQPAIISAGNRMLVSWMDTRNDQRVGEPFPDPATDPYVNDYVFAGKTKVRRRSADLLAVEAFTGQTPTFGAPKVISRYLTGVFPGESTPRTLERNKVNARMFQSGKVPFQGDYIAAAAVRFVPKDPIGSPGAWISSAGAANVQPIFHLAWTDNRLVRGDVSKGLADATGTEYTPPPISTASETDPPTPRGTCSPAAVGTRDQSVFAARVTPSLLLTTASASKASAFTDATGSHSILRSYALIVQNSTPTAAGDRVVSLDIVSPTQAGVTASFRKLSADFPTPLTTLTNVAAPHRSSLARTVYVESPISIDRPVVKINLLENGVIVATAYVNPNPLAAPLDDPLDPNDRIPSDTEVDSIEVHTPDILYRATSIGTPAIDDPAIDDPAIDDPAIDDPAIDDPAIDDPAIDDPAIDDPAIDDPAIDDPAIDDPAIDDPAIDDPAIDDAAVPSSSVFDPDTSTGTAKTGQKLTQITWKIALKGNTTTAMTSKVYLAVSDAKLAALKAAIGPGKSQLLVSRRYRTADVRGAGCTPARVTNYQVIANVVDPALTNDPSPPDLVNPDAGQPTFAVPPGDAVYVTFRVWGDTPLDPTRVGTIVQSQPGPPALEPLDSDVIPDTTAPTLVLPGGISHVVTAEATGPGGAVVTYTAAANDNADGAVSATCSPLSGSTFSIGTSTVQCRAVDAAGNVATGSFDVVVADTAPPVLSLPASIVAEAIGPQGAPVTYSATATDLIAGSVTPTCSPASGSTFPLGVTNVACSASDGFNTATGTFAITVRDTIAPTVVVPADIVREATSAAGAAATFSATATDSVAGALTPTCSPASGATFPLGTTTVTCSASDGVNTGSGTFSVSVRDTTAPTVVVPADIVREATSAAGAAATFSATATDAVAGTLTPACSPASGATFPLGTTTVTCSASDGVNTGTGTFSVTVRDATAPTVVVPADIVREAASAAGTAVTFSATATDSVAGTLTPTCSPSSGATFPLGATTVTCSATDGTNTGTGTFKVTVRDTTPPVITGTPADITVPAGAAGAVVTYALPTAVDLVAGPRPVSCSPASGSTFSGTTTVTCTASDTAAPANSATTTFRVIVIPDTVGPTISDSVSPSQLWPPDGTTVPVIVSGVANDASSGMATISWVVVDEYHQVEPKGSIAVTNGPFSFTIMLLRDRRGSDKDGRHYSIQVTATDKAGNKTAAAPIVVNVHDQSGG